MVSLILLAQLVWCNIMCKNAYERLSKDTNKVMIFCRKMGNEALLSQLCISQRFCMDKNRYIEINQKRDCKYYK